ncbi:MAG: Lrp/AsnC family transcriptional regulator [Candidatus Bathyarchaeota archaeon]|nr:MAG: Lrp/AsnC family transcriptional regulator [Candidatus Bathyarchaeota archaeon]
MKLKNIDNKLLVELIRNCRRSDRELAKKLGVSQPTVTRRRRRLEEEALDGYTAIPKWPKLGYGILAITLVKTPLKFASNTKMKEALDKSMEWLSQQPNVIMGSGCRGMGMSGLMISVHKTYGDLDEFLDNHKSKLGELLEDTQTLIVNLSGRGVYRPLNFKYLAEAM